MRDKKKWYEDARYELDTLNCGVDNGCKRRAERRARNRMLVKGAIYSTVLLVAILTPLFMVSTLPPSGDAGTSNPPSSAGYDDGYSSGYEDGLSKGLEEGNQSGYESGYEQGFADGNDTGYANGYVQGYGDGVEDGNSSGYSQGFSDGYSDGYADGYLDGYAAGNADGYSSGYADGYSDGYANGTADGYASGYTDGYGDGYADGQWEDKAEGSVTLPPSYTTLGYGYWSHYRMTIHNGSIFDICESDELNGSCKGINFTVHRITVIDWGWQMSYITNNSIEDIENVTLSLVLYSNASMQISIYLRNQTSTWGGFIYLGVLNISVGMNAINYTLVGEGGFYDNMSEAIDHGAVSEVSSMFILRTIIPSHYHFADYDICIDQFVTTFYSKNLNAGLYRQFYDIPGYVNLVPITFVSVVFVVLRKKKM